MTIPKQPTTDGIIITETTIHISGWSVIYTHNERSRISLLFYIEGILDHLKNNVEID